MNYTSITNANWRYVFSTNFLKNNFYGEHPADGN